MRPLPFFEQKSGGCLTASNIGRVIRFGLHNISHGWNALNFGSMRRGSHVWTCHIVLGNWARGNWP